MHTLGKMESYKHNKVNNKHSHHQHTPDISIGLCHSVSLLSVSLQYPSNLNAASNGIYHSTPKDLCSTMNSHGFEPHN